MGSAPFCRPPLELISLDIMIMKGVNKFNILKLKGILGKISDLMRRYHIPYQIIFILLGIISTIWFLIRVIPKPSRANYPCMRAAAPFMSGLIIYLLSIAGFTLAAKKAQSRLINVRLISSFLLIFGMMAAAAVNPSSNSISASDNIPVKTGPDDGPNQPFGTGKGIYPGRVIWAWDTLATTRECKGYYFNPENYEQKVISKMFSASVKKLAGKSSVSKSWDAFFRDFNRRKNNEDRGYRRGEKIFIKINQTSGRGRLTNAERAKGNYDYPLPKAGNMRNYGLGTCETAPYLVLEILRQLVLEAGVAQQDITVGDPQNPTFNHNYKVWAAEFPDVIYADRSLGTFGRTLIHPTKNDLLFYSDKYQTDKLYDVIENADYLINVANLKPHTGTGITLTAKNHFGSQSRTGAYHLHYSHICQLEGKTPTNAGYHKYRVLVDLMGSKYLGQNTLLFVIDGLFSGGSSEGGPPVKYFMAPFNGDWSNSIFLSQDQVALESVCYDFLRTEWNGTYSHDPSNNFLETWPNINGVDDYLHQAAERENWPKGIIYDPDNSGTPIPSLGVHEHWNNPVNKQYSRNLGKSYGIELISIPENITGPKAPPMVPQSLEQKKVKQGINCNTGTTPNSVQKTTTVLSEKSEMSAGSNLKITSIVKRSVSNDLSHRRFYAAVLDDNDGKHFLTDAGIVNGRMSPVINENSEISPSSLTTFVYELSEEGPELWFATPEGAVSAPLPVDNRFSFKNLYDTSNSSIASNKVLAIAVSRNHLKWFGTDKGISAFYKNKWLANSYRDKYPDALFKEFPVTSMATSLYGDSLYIATRGAGVVRLFRDKTDGISGASAIAQWGPIKLPSDSVYSICITKDGTQWFGTNMGAARHTGNNTVENWTVFNTDNGLVDNFVQTIAAEPYGKNVWFGTKGGVAVFDGSGWATLTTNDGLISNNILFILIDKNGVVYLCTDKGLMIYNFGVLTCYI